MEAAANFKLIRLLCFVFLLSLTAGACSSARKAPETGERGAPPVATPSVGTPEVMGPPEPYGPMPAAPAPVYGPEPVQLRPIVLVLGPGMARGFAYAGVLRAFQEARVPIGAIVGTEMGAMFGALYGMKGTINDFEWALLKFKDDSFPGKPALLSKFFRSANDGRKLEDALAQVFGNRDLSEAKIPLRMTIESEESGTVVLVDRGEAAKGIRAAVAVPGLFDSAPWAGGRAKAADDKRPFPVSEARSLGLGPIVVVDVLDNQALRAAVSADEGKAVARMQAAATAGAADLKEADLVIRPDMRGIGYLDFGKRTETAFRGKSAVLDQAPALRHLAGMPEPDPKTDGGTGL